MALSQDKGYFLAAVGLVLVSAGACGTLMWKQMTAPTTGGVVLELSDTPYTPAVAETEVVKTDTWAAPAAQSRGRDWIYDTFTPPEIFYNPRYKHFTVKPPAAVVSEDVAADEPFGLDLVSVRDEPYRLQLIGYVGGPGSWRGTFENVASGEVFLATAGKQLPKLALTIKSFEVRTVEVKIGDTMTTHQLVATAVILDEKTNKEMIITHRERAYTGGLSAFVSLTGETATREVRMGESFKIGDTTYHIDKIQLSPPSIDVTKDATSLPQADRRTLSPRETEESPAADTPRAPVTQ
jgi:hypothetical protein